MLDESPGDILLTTKLAIPPMRTHLALRPRLTDRLRDGVLGKLTLVAAPAGFGKTTLLTEWHATRPSRELPLAWVSLDAGDNDPIRFWRYVITALEVLHPGTGEAALRQLQSPQPPAMEAILAGLLNALSAIPGDTVLALDDYHLIEAPGIHHALSYVLDQLPSSVHLLISARDDPPLPLARFRARGDLVELRAADLRFTTDETATFLTQFMGLDLSAEDVRTLEERTEGWIAGLQLAALAMRNRNDVREFITAFAGSNRYVADYLVEEVLLRQPETLRTFLLRTSILDRLCASLCDALMGWESGSQAVLDDLERANLFVIALDDDRQWSRYHHLFAEMLRHRLDHMHNRLVPELHGTASRWFEQQGLIGEAISHDLAARDVERAARLIDEHGLRIMLRGQVETVLGWITALPDEPTRSRAGLCMTHAVALMFSGEMHASEARVMDAEACVDAEMPQEEARTVLGAAALVRANLAQYRGDLLRFVDLSRQACDLLPEREVMVRTVAEGGAACGHLVNGDVTEGSERVLRSAVAAARDSGDLMASLMSLTHLAGLQVMQGRLRQAAATYREAPHLPPSPSDLNTLVGSAAYYFGLGDLLRELNDLDAASRHLQQGMDLVGGAIQVNACHVAVGYFAVARLRQARGEYDGALSALNDFAQLAHERNFVASLLLDAAAMGARVELARDNLAAATRWAEGSSLSSGDASSFLREAEYVTLARVLIAQGRTASRQEGASGPLHDALHLLDRLRSRAETAARIGSVIEMDILRALALHALEDTPHAIAALKQALILAEPEGYVRIFVDQDMPMKSLLSTVLAYRMREPVHALQDQTLQAYMRQLLAAFDRPGSPRERQGSEGHPLGTALLLLDPLTERELTVLRLIAAGLSNRDIATQLYLTVGTVKWYVNSLFSKLEVHSRTQAVVQARALDILAG